MLPLEEIKTHVAVIAPKYDIAKMDMFGSYATGAATDNSDIDFLVQFHSPVTLFKLARLKYVLEDALHVPVDIIHAPIPKNSLLVIDKVVPVYERA